MGMLYFKILNIMNNKKRINIDEKITIKLGHIELEKNIKKKNDKENILILKMIFSNFVSSMNSYSKELSNNLKIMESINIDKNMLDEAPFKIIINLIKTFFDKEYHQFEIRINIFNKIVKELISFLYAFEKIENKLNDYFIEGKIIEDDINNLKKKLGITKTDKLNNEIEKMQVKINEYNNNINSDEDINFLQQKEYDLYKGIIDDLFEHQKIMVNEQMINDLEKIEKNQYKIKKEINMFENYSIMKITPIKPSYILPKYERKNQFYDYQTKQKNSFDIQINTLNKKKLYDSLMKILRNIFDGKELYSENLHNKLIELIIKKPTFDQIFLACLKIFKEKGNFKNNKNFIKSLGIIFNLILEKAEKNKNYQIGNSIITLSFSFYYLDNNDKIYLAQDIKNNQWVNSFEFWIEVIEIEIKMRIKKNGEDLDFLNKTENNICLKYSQIAFSILTHAINYMHEIGFEKKVMINIANEIIIKYFFTKDKINDIYAYIDSL